MTRGFRQAVTAFACMLGVLAGCDPRRIEKLEEGVSTEADVRKQFGEPAGVTVEADGTRVLDYPRQPQGWTNFVIRIGPDGTMASLRQLLTPDNFARVSAGMTRREVERLLGRPARVQRLAIGQQEVVYWRFKPVNESLLFSATFDRDGRVVSTAIGPDPRENDGGS